MKSVVLLSLVFCFSLGDFLYRDFHFNGTLSEVNGATTLTPIGLTLAGTNPGAEQYHFGRTNINGVATTALFFNNTGFYVKTAPPNGGSDLYVYSYSLLMDVYFDQSNNQTVIPIYNSFPNNDMPSAVSLLSYHGISIDEMNFSGNFTLNIWYRIVVVADLQNMALNVSIFNGVTGRFLGTTAADPMTYSLYSYPGSPPLDSVLLFASSCFPGPSGAIHFLRFYNYALTPTDANNLVLAGPQVSPPAAPIFATTAPPTYLDPIVFGTTNNNNNNNNAPNVNAIANPFSGPYFSTVLGVSLGITFFVLIVVLLWVGALSLWRRSQQQGNELPLQVHQPRIIIADPSVPSTPMQKTGYDILPNTLTQSQPGPMDVSTYSPPFPVASPTYANKTQGYGVAINANQ